MRQDRFVRVSVGDVVSGDYLGQRHRSIGLDHPHDPDVRADFKRQDQSQQKENSCSKFGSSGHSRSRDLNVTDLARP
jgi:hypothetical protein